MLIFLKLLRLVLYKSLSQRMFHVHFREMYILLLFGGVFCIHTLSLTGLQCCSCPLFPTDIQSSFLSITECVILKSPAIGLPWCLRCKESAYNAENPALIPQLGRFPGEGNGYPLEVFLPGVFHGQRNLVGYSPFV